MASEKETLQRKIVHAAGWQAARRLGKMIPVGGTLVAIALVGSDIRKKGLLGGIVNAGLDAVPGVGLAKNAIEAVRGDLIPDKVQRRRK